MITNLRVYLSFKLYCVVSNICINSMSDTRSGVYTIIHCPQGPQPPTATATAPKQCTVPGFYNDIGKILESSGEVAQIMEQPCRCQHPPHQLCY